MNRVVIGIIFILFVSNVAFTAVPTINVGTRYLLPDQAGQQIYIYVTGGDPVEGLEFRAQIGGNVSGPTFDGYASDEGVDILTGTIFADPNNQGIFPGSYIDPRNAYVGTTTPIGTTVNAEGLLATITLDTAGLGLSGREEYSLSLIYTLEGRTNFAGVEAVITDGTLVIPEPTSLAIMLMGTGLILRRRQRQNRK